MSADEVLEICSKRIAEIERQRDKARQQLRTAKSIIRDLLIAFVADAEFDADQIGNTSVKVRAYHRGERFLSKKK